MKHLVPLSAAVLLFGCLPLRRLPPAPEAPAEHTGLVTLRGKPVTLLGRMVAVGDVAPDFRVMDADSQPTRLSDFKGKAVLISVVPSLDTAVCSAQTKRFNDEAAKLPPDVVVLTLSTDLPFAQTRFCQEHKIGRIRVLSDHVWREFGLSYGVLMKGRGLLSRSIFVIGKDGRVAYKELVAEVSTHPNYDAAVAAAREAAAH